MAALHMALDCPERLGGLVLLSTSAEAETPERRSQLETLALTLRVAGPSRWLVRSAADLYFSRDYAHRAPEQIDRWCTTVRSMPKRGLLQALQAIRTRPSVLDRLNTIQTPALVMCSTADPICEPGRSEAIAARMINATHQSLPGGGHALPMEQPEALGEAVRRFLSRIPDWEQPVSQDMESR